MAINYPGPYELRISYTPDIAAGVAIQRQQRLNVKLVEPVAQTEDFANIAFEDRNGVVGNTLDDLVEDWLALVVPLYHNLTTIDGVELWKYPTPQSFDAVFWSAYAPIIVAGTAGNANNSAGQDLYSFTTAEGGTMKVNFMEDISVPGPPIGLAALTSSPAAVVAFVLDGDGVNYSAPFLGRDTSFPVKFNRQFPGRNEALWKKRNGR